MRFIVYLKDNNKRARNTKLVSVFFTASESIFGVYPKGITKKQNGANLHRSNFLYSKSNVSVFDELNSLQTVYLAYNIACIAFGRLILVGEIVHVEFPVLLYLEATESVTWFDACVFCSYCNKAVVAEVFDVANSVGVPSESYLSTFFQIVAVDCLFVLEQFRLFAVDLCVVEIVPAFCVDKFGKNVQNTFRDIVCVTGRVSPESFQGGYGNMFLALLFNECGKFYEFVVSVYFPDYLFYFFA